MNLEHKIDEMMKLADERNNRCFRFAGQILGAIFSPYGPPQGTLDRVKEIADEWKKDDREISEQILAAGE